MPRWGPLGVLADEEDYLASAIQELLAEIQDHQDHEVAHLWADRADRNPADPDQAAQEASDLDQT